MTNPITCTVTEVRTMTGTDLDRACSAAKFLLSDPVRAHIGDAALVARLASLRDDLEAEQDERRRIAKH